MKKGENWASFAIEYILDNGKLFITKEHKETGIYSFNVSNDISFSFRFHALRLLRFLIFSSRLVGFLHGWMIALNKKDKG